MDRGVHVGEMDRGVREVDLGSEVDRGVRVREMDRGVRGSEVDRCWRVHVSQQIMHVS